MLILDDWYNIFTPRLLDGNSNGMDGLDGYWRSYLLYRRHDLYVPPSCAFQDLLFCTIGGQSDNSYTCSLTGSTAAHVSINAVVLRKSIWSLSGYSRK